MRNTSTLAKTFAADSNQKAGLSCAEWSSIIRLPKVTDESTDAYDTVAWLIKNIPGNNGRVRVIGTSYDGALTMAAGIDPHPAVKAISPQAPMIDTWMGDDFFHNGAFRQSYGYDYAMGLEQSKDNSDVSYGKDVGWLRILLAAGLVCRGCSPLRGENTGGQGIALVEQNPGSIPPMTTSGMGAPCSTT